MLSDINTAESTSVIADAVCACCRAPLTRESDQLVCTADPCHSFPVVGGVPILINDDNSVFTRADFTRPARADEIHEGMYGSKQEFSRQRGLHLLYRRFARFISNYRVDNLYLQPQEALDRVATSRACCRVLVLGAGDERLSARNAMVVHTDVAAGHGVDYVLDAHDIPFPDGSFDLVVVSSVLEHVADPPRVVAEIHRVLAPDGHVYACTPFMQPVHMGPYDFTRYTYAGYRRLFRFFDEVVFQAALGPGSSLGYSLEYFLTSFSDNHTVQGVLRLIGRTGSLPLKHLDRFLNRRRAALDAAGGYVFLGRRRETAVADRLLVEMVRQRRYGSAG